MLTRSHPSRLNRTRRLIVGLVCAFGFLTASSDAVAEDVLIVIASGAAPYIEAAKSCKLQLNNSGIKVESVQLAKLNAADIQKLDGTVIAIGGRASAALAQHLPSTTKLFYCMTPQPKKIGLTTRANTSGIRIEIALHEQVALIERGLGTVDRIGVLYRSSSASSAQIVEDMRSVLPPGIELVAVDMDPISSPSDAIKKLLREKIDVVWTVPDTSVYNSATIKALLLESIRKNTPVFGFSHALVRAGATFGAGISPAEQGTFVAELVIKGADGVHPYAEPSLAINQLAAERVKIEFSNSYTRHAAVIFHAD